MDRPERAHNDNRRARAALIYCSVQLTPPPAPQLYVAEDMRSVRLLFPESSCPFKGISLVRGLITEGEEAENASEGRQR